MGAFVSIRETPIKMIMRLLVMVFILSVGSNAAALRCTDWVEHVRTEHQIYFRKKPVLKFPFGFGWKHIDLGHPTWEISTPPSVRTDARLLKRGTILSADDGVFRFNLEINEKNECQNFSVMTKRSKALWTADAFKKSGLSDDHVVFWYDWKICQQALSLTNGKRLRTDEIARLPFKAREKLKKLDIAARSEPFGTTLKGQAYTLYSYDGPNVGPEGLVGNCVAAEDRLTYLNSENPSTTRRVSPSVK